MSLFLTLLNIISLDGYLWIKSTKRRGFLVGKRHSRRWVRAHRSWDLHFQNKLNEEDYNYSHEDQWTAHQPHLAAWGSTVVKKYSWANYFLQWVVQRHAVRFQWYRRIDQIIQKGAHNLPGDYQWATQRKSVYYWASKAWKRTI